MNIKAKQVSKVAKKALGKYELYRIINFPLLLYSFKNQLFCLPA
jgi:hypothetical protein